MIDLHCHVLPGIDDGPETIEASIALARRAEESGVHTIIATPHVSWSYENDSETIARLVNEVNSAVASAGVTVEVLAGAEIAMTRCIDLPPTEVAALGLANGPWLLLECPFSSHLTGIQTLALELHEQGQRIILAHPERCPAFQHDPSLLESLVQEGLLTSVTAGSLVGRFGKTVRRFAHELMDAELVHNVASDAHDIDRRPPGMAAELEQAGFGSLSEWLTEQVPAAILAGQDAIPPRPRARHAKHPPGRRWRGFYSLRQAS